MNHADIQIAMADYLEGELSLGKRALFDAHLADCEECATELATMRATIGLLRGLPTPEPPADLAASVMRRIEGGEGQLELFGRVARWFGELRSLAGAPRFAVPASALAAGLAVALVTGDQGPGTGSDSFVAQRQANSSEAVTAKHSSHSPVESIARSQRPPQQKRQTRPDRGVLGEALARSAAVPRAPHLGMRGSSLGADSSHLAGVPVRRRAGDQSLAMASAQVGGVVQARSTRSRDEWLDVLIEQPQGFALEHVELTSVEQELWIRHLALRAVELSRLEEVVAALRGTANPVAVTLADSFVAAAPRHELAGQKALGNR